jgi:hypothetical protein
VSLQRKGVLEMMNLFHIRHFIINENLLKSLEQSSGSFHCKEDSLFHVVTDSRINYRNSYFVLPCCSKLKLELLMCGKGKMKEKMPAIGIYLDWKALHIGSI